MPTERVDDITAGLVTKGLLAGTTDLTDRGRAELAHARAQVAQATGRLVEGIDRTDLEVCARVLDTVRAAAERTIAEA